VQAGLAAPAPAEAGLMTRLAAARPKAAVAIEAVMRLPPADRASGMPAAWAAATTDILSRFDQISTSLTERVRLVDPAIAELMSLKQIGWLVRDNAGLERNLYSDAINTKSLPAALQRRIASYRGRIDAGWGLLRELTARPGAPAVVVAAIQGAAADFFGTFDKQRAELHATLAAGQPTQVTLAEWLRVSTKALDSLIQVPNAAVAEAQAHAEQRATDAARRLSLQGGLLAIGILVGGAGFLIAQSQLQNRSDSVIFFADL
jgi:hypothetical protein